MKIFPVYKNIPKISSEKYLQLWSEEILKTCQTENYGTSFSTEVSSKPHKANGYKRTRFFAYYWPFLNWIKVIQRCHRTPWDAVGQATEGGDTRWKQLRRELISATGQPLDEQFWTSLWVTVAQSSWALTGSSRCPLWVRALLLPCRFQSLRPAPFMLSFPISAHGRTDASQSHVTSCSVHPCAADQHCKPPSNSNQQTGVLKPFYPQRASIPHQELLKSSLPSLPTLHTQLLWSQN